MKTKEKTSKLKTFAIVFAAIIFAVCISVIAIQANSIKDYKQQNEIAEEQNTDFRIIKETINNSSRLETADYFCTIVENSYDCKKLFGKDIPLTETGYLVSFDGTVSAGIDLSKAVVKQLDEKTIEVSLPKVEIYDVNFDNESMKKYDEKSSILNPLKIDKVNNTEIKAKKRIKEEAIKKGIETRAKDNAETIVAGQLAQCVNGSKVKITWQ